MVKIRMTRTGRTKLPLYTIVAANSKNARDGRFLQKLGNYNPKATPMLTNMKLEEMKEWVGKGAQLSDTVRTLLKAQSITL